MLPLVWISPYVWESEGRLDPVRLGCGDTREGKREDFHTPAGNSWDKLDRNSFAWNILSISHGDPSVAWHACRHFIARLHTPACRDFPGGGCKRNRETEITLLFCDLFCSYFLYHSSPFFQVAGESFDFFRGLQNLSFFSSLVLRVRIVKVETRWFKLHDSAKK